MNKTIKNLITFCLILIIGIFFLQPVKAESTPSITEFTPSGASHDFRGIASGPDGNLWFTAFINSDGTTGGTSRIGKVTTNGEIEEYPITTYPVTPDQFVPYDIVAGSDGNLWFTGYLNSEGYKIGRISSAGTILGFFDLPTASSTAFRITNGPDGNLWFTEPDPAKIGRITPSGIVTEFVIPDIATNYRRPESIISGGDGNVWFTLRSTSNGSSSIAKITTNGDIIEYPITQLDTELMIAKGADGNVWFTEVGARSIGKITPGGNITKYNISSGNIPWRITSGLDGNLWFTEVNSEFIGKITTNGVITEYPITITGGQPDFITQGQDGNLWFTEVVNNTKIGRVNLNIASTPSPLPSATPTTTPTPSTIKDVGFKPSYDGFGFKNYGYDPLSWEMYEQFFGKENVYADNGQRLAIANQYFEESYKQVAKLGNCFGFTGASLINYLKINQTSAGTFSLLGRNGYFDVKSNSYYNEINLPQYDLRKSLGFYQGVQLGYEMRALKLENKEKTTIDHYKAIKSSINKGDPVGVSIYKVERNKQLGHSLAAYRYEEIGNTLKVYVYDSNNPGDDNKYITFDLEDNSWTYVSFNYLFGLMSDVWQSEPNKSNMSTYPINLYTKKGIPLWENEKTTSMIIVPAAISSLVSTSDGKKMGIIDGEVVEEIDNAVILPNNDVSDAIDELSTTYMTSSDRNQKLNIKNATGGQDRIYVYNNDSYISLSGLVPYKDNTGAIELGAKGKSVTVISDHIVNNLIVKLDQEINKRSLIFTITNIFLSKGENTTFELVGDNGSLKVKNRGMNKTYSLTMQEVGGSNSTITLNDITIDNNSSQIITPGDWDNLSGKAITLATDKNNDGVVDSSTIINAITINESNEYTNKRDVLLHLVPTSTQDQMRISNGPFRSTDKNPKWQNYEPDIEWKLSNGNGKKTVYVQFKKGNTVSEIYKDSILLDTRKPRIGDISINNDQRSVNNTKVRISIKAIDNLSGIQYMKVSNTKNMSNTTWQTYKKEFEWNLQPLQSNKPQLRQVYIQLKDKSQNVSRIFKGYILLKPN